MRAAIVILALWPTFSMAQMSVESSPSPLSRPDPEDREGEILADIAKNGAILVEPASPSVRDTLTEADAAFDACVVRLDAFGAEYALAERVVDGADVDCGITRPVSVSQIVPGVTLQPDAVMRCETAARLAEWVAGSVQPAAALMESRGEVVQIQHGSTYICRRRNNLADGKLSEHAFGNAVDIMGFEFKDGSRVDIEPRADAGTIEEAFQRAVRGTACLSFTTVLGPGTDASHADHLHLDVKARNGGYRICQ